MTVKTAISFTDKHHEYARKKVNEGAFDSVSSVVAACLEQAMSDEEERELMLHGMAEPIRARLELPREEWVDMEQENLIEAVKQTTL